MYALENGLPELNSNEAPEMTLAHAVSNKVETAYRRGDLLKKRLQLMQDWATFFANTHAAAVRPPAFFIQEREQGKSPACAEAFP
jgi:hypothetical protein